MENSVNKDNSVKLPKVLLVDDSPVYVAALKEALQSFYSLSSVTNGEEAFTVAQTYPQPDLILLDVTMPGIDGYETCRKLKRLSKTKEIPVIFLTGKGDIDSLVKGFDVGAVDYIHKPFNTPELLARVKTHIELKLAREEISTLQGILPICASCKKIRNDDGYWDQIETYISHHSQAEFSHGMCPDCVQKHYGDILPKK